MHTLYFDLRDTKGQQKAIDDKIYSAAKILREGGSWHPHGDGVRPGGQRPGRRCGPPHLRGQGPSPDNTPIIHVTGQQWLARYCADVPPLAYVLARKFWPGPLTMILKRKPIIPDQTTAGLDTVGVRCPNHPVTLAIIREAGCPSRPQRKHLRPAQLHHRTGRAGGYGRQDRRRGGRRPCAVGVESTILDLTCDPPRLLRPGGLPLEELERLIGKIEVDKADTGTLSEGEKPRAPGMKYRHYAPKAPVTVVTGKPEKSAQIIAQRVGPTSGVICFDEYAHLFPDQVVQTLGASVTSCPRLSGSLTPALLRRLRRHGDLRPMPDNRGWACHRKRLKKAAGFHVLEAEAERWCWASPAAPRRQDQRPAGPGIPGRGDHRLRRPYHQMLAPTRTCARTSATPSRRVCRRRPAGPPAAGAGVFASKERLERLNAIVFRYMEPELRRRLEAMPAAGGHRCHQPAGGRPGPAVRPDHRPDGTAGAAGPADHGPGQHLRAIRPAADLRQKSDEYYREAVRSGAEQRRDSAEAFESEASDFSRGDREH